MENLDTLTTKQIDDLQTKYLNKSDMYFTNPITGAFVGLMTFAPVSIGLVYAFGNPGGYSELNANLSLLAMVGCPLIGGFLGKLRGKIAEQYREKYYALSRSYQDRKEKKKNAVIPPEQTEVQKRYAKIFDTPPEPTIAEINADLEKRRLRNYVKPEIASNMPSNGSEKDMELWFIGELVSKGHKARHQPTPAGKAGRPDVKITLDCGKEWQIELKTNSGNLSDKQKGYATCLKDMGKNWSCLYGTHQMKRWLDSNA